MFLNITKHIYRTYILLCGIKICTLSKVKFSKIYIRKNICIAYTLGYNLGTIAFFLEL